MDNRSPSMLKASLIGGGAAAVASAIPGLSFLNVCCCALVIGGGFLAAFLYRKDSVRADVAFGPAQGALVGLIAGAMFAIVGGVVESVKFVALGGKDYLIEQFDNAIAMNPDGTEGIEPMIRFVESTGVGMLMLLWFFVLVIVGAIFSTVGGLIGGATQKFEPAPPPTPPTGPPAPPNP